MQEQTSDNDIVLELEHVTKAFGTNFALDDVSYKVRKGTVFALLGENGAGKTTTIRILLGLCEPDRGHSRVLGMDSMKEDLKIRQSVGYVPEQPVLYDWMTVAEIGRFTSSFYPPGYMIRYTELLEGFDLRPGATIKSLSKGMRAKVSLALALAHDPELLILDEPTSGLDALVRREFLESMVDRAATGRTVFLSSHQIAEVERVADTVAIMKKSKLLVLDSLESLKSSTHLLTVTLKENLPLDAPFGTVVEDRVSGREHRILGHDLRSDAETALRDNSNIARYELKSPGLEDIFIAYMNS